MRQILVISAIIAVIQTSSAQIIRSYGIKAGAVLAGQHWDYSPSSPLAGIDIADQMRWGLDVGCFIEWLDTPTFTLITEAHYLQRGFREELPATSPASPDGIWTQVLTPRLDYLSIPLLMKARIDFASVSPYLLSGPRYDVLLSKNPDGYDLVIDQIKDYDWGLAFGAGIVYDLSPCFDVGAEFRYDLSFQDIYKTNILTVRNHSMQFQAYIAF